MSEVETANPRSLAPEERHCYSHRHQTTKSPSGAACSFPMSLRWSFRFRDSMTINYFAPLGLKDTGIVALIQQRRTLALSHPMGRGNAFISVQLGFKMDFDRRSHETPLKTAKYHDYPS